MPCPMYDPGRQTALLRYCRSLHFEESFIESLCHLFALRTFSPSFWICCESQMGTLELGGAENGGSPVLFADDDIPQIHSRFGGGAVSFSRSHCLGGWLD